MLILTLQVCFGDITEKEAQETLGAFRLKYGEDKVIYQQCDVQKNLDVESESKDYV